MKRLFVLCAVAALALLSLGSLAQADVLLDEFNADPFTSITNAGDLLTGRIAAPGFAFGQAWTFQANVAIDSWQHYGALRLGVEGQGYWGTTANVWDQDYVALYKNDAGQTVTDRQIYGTTGGAWRQALGTSNALPGVGAYDQINFWFDPARGYKERVSRNGIVLAESTWDQWGDMSMVPTSIMVQISNTSGLGYIAYNEDTHGVDYYSYAGSEGIYTYSQSGSIYQLGLTQGISDNLFPAVPEPSSIVALFGGLVSLLAIRRRKA